MPNVTDSWYKRVFYWNSAVVRTDVKGTTVLRTELKNYDSEKQTDWAVEQRNLECWTCVLLKKTSLFSTVSLFSSFSPVYVQDKWGDRDKRSCHPQLWDYFSHCTPRDQIRPFKNQKSLCIVFECLQTKGNTKYVFFKYIRLTNKFEKKIALICPIPTISTDLCSLSLRIVNVECLQSNHLNVFGGA